MSSVEVTAGSLGAAGSRRYASIFARAVDDRWRGMAIAIVIVGGVLVMGMAAYGQIDLSIYTDLPEAMRSVMGIPTAADAATLSYGVMYSLVAAMTLAGFAVSLGAASIAGEERAGTIAVLLGNPRSRREVLVGRAGAMVAVVAFGAILAYAAAVAAPALLGVAIGEAHLGALMLHMCANALLYGAVAVAVGGWTGNRSLASGAAAGTMVLSYFLVGLLPLISSVAEAAKVVPWYWFSGHDPIQNGVHLGYLALQVGVTVLLAASAWVGVERRDLRKQVGASSLLDRLRAHPIAAQVVGRLSGSASVSQVWVKTASENRVLLTIASASMFLMMGLMMGPIYAVLEPTLVAMGDSLPEAMLALAGGSGMSTPEGWYQTESMGLMGPVAVILVAAAVGARALAGEEQQRTMGLLLANPIRRSRIVVEKALAMLVHTAIVGVATFAGVAGGSLIAGLGMSVTNIAAASFLLTLLGVMFGALGLAIGAGTGSTRAATVGTAGAAASLYVLNSILSIGATFEGWRWVSPFHWYLNGEPLVNGMDWGAAALFAAVGLGLVALSVVLFERRDLRRG